MKNFHHYIVVPESPESRILYSGIPFPEVEQSSSDLVPLELDGYCASPVEVTNESNDSGEPGGEIQEDTPVLLTSVKNLSSAEISTLTDLAEGLKHHAVAPKIFGTSSSGVTNRLVEVANDFLYSGSTLDG